MKRGGEGLSLIEVIIAVAFFSLVAVALFNLLGGSYIGLNSSSSYQKALFYAQEGAEAARSIRNQAWNNLIAGSHGLILAENRWQFSGSEELLDNFYTRQIIVEDVYRDGSGSIVEPASPGANLDLHIKKIISFVSWPSPGGENSEIRLPLFLTSWQTKNWIQTDWQSGPGQDIWQNPTRFFSDDSNVDYLTAGQIVLKQNGPPIVTASYGNQFLISGLNTSSTRLDANGKKVSLRFTAQQTKNVNRVRIYIQTRSNPPVYRFGLQADNGSGNPTGIYLGYGDVRPPATGWLAINLNQSVALVGGQTYHLVIQWQSGTISSSRYIILRQSQPLNNLIPYDQVVDTASNVLTSTDNGASWQAQSLQPIYHLSFTDSSYEGNPYDNWLNNLLIYGSNFRGQYFSFTENKEFSQIGFYLRRQGSQPADDLRFAILNISDNVQVASDILVRRQDIQSTYAWYTYNFVAPISFTTGKNYRIYLSSANSSSTRCYVVAATSTTNNSVLKAVTFAGTTSYYQYSTNGGGSWSSQDYTDLNFILRLNLPSYAPQGELVSSAFNTDAPAAFDFLNWQEIIPSPNTDIWVQLATAPDNAGVPGEWGPWQGPTGLGSYYQSGVEQLIPAANNHNDNQFVRYKVILRSDSTETPVFQEIKINYTP